MNYKTIFKKELQELFRDKRVRMAVIFSPAFSIFLTMMIFGFIFEVSSKASNQKIHIVRADNSLVRALRASKAEIIEVDSVAAGEKLVRDGKARLVLNFEPDLDQKLASAQQTKVQAYYNPDEETGELSLSVVKSIFEKVNRATLDTILEKSGLNPNLAEPLKLEDKQVRVFKGQSSGIMRSLFPYFLILFIFVAGVSIASDMVAGEKEKGTLETLLVSPVKRGDIALGKFLALSTVMSLSGLSTVLSLVVIKALNLPMLQKVLKDGFNIAPEGILMIILALLPTLAFMAGSMLAISTYSRNIREAQTYLSQGSFLITIPMIISQMIGLTGIGNSLWIYFVPILNTAAVIRNAMLGKPDWVGVSITFGIGFLLATLAILSAVRMFGKEEVLLRT